MGLMTDTKKEGTPFVMYLQGRGLGVDGIGVATSEVSFLITAIICVVGCFGR